MEKEFITKKRCASIIAKGSYNAIKTGIWCILVFILCAVALYFFSYFWDHLGIDKEAIKLIALLAVVIFLVGIAAISIGILIIVEGITSLVYLHKGKFFLVESTLLSKEKKELPYGAIGTIFTYYNSNYMTAKFYNSSYISNSHFEEIHNWNFDEYGVFSIYAYHNLYPWSTNDSMHISLADSLTDVGEKFYLLVRGGKKKRIYYIFHEKLFAINPDEHHKIYGKYFI
ncbi:MAG: hypothetical protein IKB86_03620 [Clostridia bacterium]|nr:hypothetical protein [Clostridia bacterium]